MDADMRHIVVFRVPVTHVESDEWNSSDLDDWICEQTSEGKPCSSLSDTDFRYRYHLIAFTTATDAVLFREYLRSFAYIELAFDPGPPVGEVPR